MRMRRKKHLEEKLAACENLIDLPGVTRDVRVENAKPAFLDFEEIFGNANPLEMEIGCGKGRFIVELASREPNTNFIAVEVNKSVICTAAANAKAAGLKNVVFLHTSAELLPKYVRPETLGRIYLNFSCPFPKKAYENKRLTNARFLNAYRPLLKSGAGIWQKTDNMHFFEYSIEQYTLASYVLKNVCLDLHASDFEGNIVTEYESRFLALGQPIYRLEAYPKEK